MGAQQRKHPAFEAGKSHIGLTSGAESTTRWTHLYNQPAATVWMAILNLNQVTEISVVHFVHAFFYMMKKDLVYIYFCRAFESELRTYEGDDPLSVWDR